MARRLGAAWCIDPSARTCATGCWSSRGGRGADVVCEAVGKPELVAEAVTLTPSPAAFFQLVGVNPKGSRLPLDLWDVHFREIRIDGAFGRGTAYRRALAPDAEARLEPLVTRASRSTGSATPSPTPPPATA